MKYEMDLYEVKITDLEDQIIGEFYVAGENFLKAFKYVWESLNSEKEFINQIKYIGSVEFEIEAISASTVTWNEFVIQLDVRSQITNALLRSALPASSPTIFDIYDIELEKAPEWFMNEIRRPNGGRIRGIRNIGEKSIRDIRDALKVSER